MKRHVGHYAGGVGLEPTTTSLGGLRPIHTRLPAQPRVIGKTQILNLNAFSFCKKLKLHENTSTIRVSAGVPEPGLNGRQQA